MEPTELIERIANGEDSRHQHKVNIHNQIAMASEMIAFSNSGGGQILIGVGDDGSIPGLTLEDVGRINQIISNAASNMIRPSINPTTENVRLDAGMVIVVTITDGINKPYTDHQGIMWVKTGADKRRVTAREEMQRLFQSSALVQADETAVPYTSIVDLDMHCFDEFYQKRYNESIKQSAIPLPRLLENLNLVREGSLNLAGLLLFGRNPQRLRPQFMVKAVTYPGTKIHQTTYKDSQDMLGTLPELFNHSLSFVKRNLHAIQDGQGVNSVGRMEIPDLVLEELLVNALVHRDYFVSAAVRVFIFDDRLEIISPGHLLNHLTEINIRYGISNIRNPLLASFANHMLPYRGFGTGIIRALAAYPDIDFKSDRDGNQFTVTIWRTKN